MADSKISDLTAVATPTATDEFGVNQAGTSKKITLEQVAAFGPSAPTVVSVGSAFSSTATPTATLPGTHAADDILLLIVQSANQSDLSAPAGYARLGPANGIGGAGGAGSLRLQIFWKRDNGAEGAPTMVDLGDHTYGVMLAIRGCPTVGDPFHILGNAFNFVADTAVSSIDLSRTSVDNCLVLHVAAHAIDSASAQSSGEANASLSSVTEDFDGATADGVGGGIVVVSGVKATAGEVAATTHTLAASSVNVSTLIAFLPEGATANHHQARPPEVLVYIGSPPDLDDVWVRPTGASRVFVQICDGGGGGSAGNITTTAAGGGGGGGGGYDEAWYVASDLPVTCTVHAGRAGAASTALNQSGNLGVVSEFDKGGAGPLTSTYRSAGTSASAAASADGGNGGCGAGCAPGPITIQTVRRALNASNASVAHGLLGAGGGSGTTTPIGGSEAVWGGGGGESGADTDGSILSINNGNSLRGGGGGAGGRTNAGISGSGRGGGAAGVNSAQGAKGTDSAHLPFGGSGGCAGGSSVVTGGDGGFPGGGGGGGGGIAGGFGGQGGHGCVVVTTYF